MNFRGPVEKAAVISSVSEGISSFPPNLLLESEPFGSLYADAEKLPDSQLEVEQFSAGFSSGSCVQV